MHVQQVAQTAGQDGENACGARSVHRAHEVPGLDDRGRCGGVGGHDQLRRVVEPFAVDPGLSPGFPVFPQRATRAACSLFT